MSASAARMMEDVNFGVLIGSVGRGIAEAQLDLHLSTLRIAEVMATNPVSFGGESLSMLQLGFTPMFYQFVDTTIEIKVSFSVTEEDTEEHSTSESTTQSSTTHSVDIGWFSVSASSRTTAKTSTVDARFASRFQYSADASSRVSTRLVPIPPPAPLLAIANTLIVKGAEG